MGSDKRGRPEWWARDVKCPTTSCKAVLMVLASLIDKNDECWPGNTWIAARAIVSEKSVERALNWLDDVKLISRRPRYKNHKHRLPDVIAVHWRREIPAALDLRIEGDLPDTMSGSNEATYPTLCPDLTDSVSRPTRHGVCLKEQAIEENQEDSPGGESLPTRESEGCEFSKGEEAGTQNHAPPPSQADGQKPQSTESEDDATEDDIQPPAGMTWFNVADFVFETRHMREDRRADDQIWKAKQVTASGDRLSRKRQRRLMRWYEEALAMQGLTEAPPEFRAEVFA